MLFCIDIVSITINQLLFFFIEFSLIYLDPTLIQMYLKKYITSTRNEIVSFDAFTNENI